MNIGSQIICLDTFSKLAKTERLEAIELLIKNINSIVEIDSFIELMDNRLVNPTTQGRPEILGDLDPTDLTKPKRKYHSKDMNKSEVKNNGVKHSDERGDTKPVAKPFSHVKCGVSNDVRDDTKSVRKVHMGVKPHKCPVCFKTFWESHKLKVHGVVHSGQKPFSCDKCDKKFASHGSCYNHKKRFHDGNKPFTCDICQKSWAIQIDLILHRRNHTGEKPYTCSVCQMKFSRSSCLILHKKRCTGIRMEKKSSKINLFSCSICKKTFPTSHSLFRHNKLHTGEKPHSCKVCGKAYIQKSSLKYHIKAVHDKENE